MCETPFYNEEARRIADTLTEKFDKQYFEIMGRVVLGLPAFDIEPSKPIGEDYE